MDDALLDVILGRLDGDTGLPADATDLVIAACLGDRALADALDGASQPRRPRRASGHGPATQPAGVFLRSITVEGFRGVGPACTLDLPPGRGLTVVAGRNGSGKSSFAEGLEVLLTGSTARFASYAVFRDGWRNLHRPHPTRLRAEMQVEGTPGATVVERTWQAGAGLDDGTCVAHPPEGEASNLDGLGWARDLATYNPFLAHADLEAMFAGKPSDLYDRLAAVLGLGDLTATQDRLATRRRTLEATIKDANHEQASIDAALRDLEDERATAARTALDTRTPDLDAAAQLVTGAGGAPPGGALDALRQLANLAAPDPVAATEAAERLRRAAGGLEAVAGTETARARALADLLARAVDLHDHHPADTACPVCGHPGALDDAWHEHAAAEVRRLEGEAEAAERAHREAAAAVRHATALVSVAPAALDRAGDLGLDAGELVAAWASWAAPPQVAADHPDALLALADHLGRASDLATRVEDVRGRAARDLAARDDRWTPVARRIAAWIDQGRSAAAARPTVALLKQAEAWLKAAHDDVRNERLRPIAERAQATWRALRHESNVELGAIRLSGSATGPRRVVLDATVDGSDGSALGVMSQGEVNALALSIFLPRAMLPESPFRFVVIDDPVQAMDPAKVDGLARVLHDAGQTHQVVVFTHDDRLPNALRRLDLDARILQVHRRPGSVVALAPVGDPVTRALSDARSVARDRRIPDDVKGRVVPGQCRVAVEAALADIVVRRQLRAGRAHHDVDALLADAVSLRDKAALVLFRDSARRDDVEDRLRALGDGHASTFGRLNAGAHGRLRTHAGDLVASTGRLIEALRRAAT